MTEYPAVCSGPNPRAKKLPVRHINLARRRRALDPNARDMASRLNLQRPLVVVNLATTGALRRSARIAGILTVKLWPGGDTSLRLDTVNPGMPIPRDATNLHGIPDAVAAGSPAFAAIASGLVRVFADCDVMGIDAEGADIALLEVEFYLAGIDLPLTKQRVDAHHILLDHERRGLEAAVRFDCGVAIAPARDVSAAAPTSSTCCFGRLATCASIATELDPVFACQSVPRESGVAQHPVARSRAGRQPLSSPGPAGNEHGGDGHDRRVAKVGKRLFPRNDATQHERQQREQRHRVVSPPPPHEEDERDSEHEHDE